MEVFLVPESSKIRMHRDQTNCPKKHNVGNPEPVSILCLTHLQRPERYSLLMLRKLRVLRLLWCFKINASYTKIRVCLFLLPVYVCKIILRYFKQLLIVVDMESFSAFLLYKTFFFSPLGYRVAQLCVSSHWRSNYRRYVVSLERK